MNILFDLLNKNAGEYFPPPALEGEKDSNKDV
jgi:hypothetical protein